jgi:hypothetical protein
MLFGVLQAKFQVTTNPCRQWNKEVIGDVLMACVVLHNMISENVEGKNLKLTW